ncbi:WD40-repeat-containing domain protein [Kickxella alabastrina]|uniref:WD40-repeat-containing domain protein n=1 Tax=Kickxella alabastrina TaxID=61397 RepID=UPI00221EA122|nr:WD40-repeat-containing domain protein [Kickxella alabastrina]KAI7829264.1 WD40-repeat-containing domain protein [Kickxella alabastrina]
MFPCKYRTAGFKGYAVKFSPFTDRLLASAASANFGLVGNGRLSILTTTTTNTNNSRTQSNTNNSPLTILPQQHYGTQDGLFDLSWNELHENQLISASGDGSIKLWDITLKTHPVAKWKEHKREVMSVEWNYTAKTTFLSSSWDGSVKLWNPVHAQGSRLCYTAAWSPRHQDQFASCGEDKSIRLWSTNAPQSRSIASFGGHTDQVVSLDWNKYSPDMFVTSSTDRTIKIWDTRNLRGSVTMFGPFEFPVRRVKFCPFSPHFIATAGYDMSASVWDVRNGSVTFVHDAHTEFVFGIDWSYFHPGQIASCGWDEQIHVFNVPLPQ